LDKKCVWLHFGRFDLQAHLVTLRRLLIFYVRAFLRQPSVFPIRLSPRSRVQVLADEVAIHVGIKTLENLFGSVVHRCCCCIRQRQGCQMVMYIFSPKISLGMDYFNNRLLKAGIFGHSFYSNHF
jgi:hypothetical protein